MSIIPADGSYVRKHDFNGIDGAHPYGGLVEVNNKLYGLTSGGGVNGKGVLFAYDPITNNYEKKFDFGGLSGEAPYSEMVVTANGNLYGVTSGAGQIAMALFLDIILKKILLPRKRILMHPQEETRLADWCLTSSGMLYGMAYEGGCKFAWNDLCV